MEQQRSVELGLQKSGSELAMLDEGNLELSCLPCPVHSLACQHKLSFIMQHLNLSSAVECQEKRSPVGKVFHLNAAAIFIPLPYNTRGLSGRNFVHQ